MAEGAVEAAAAEEAVEAPVRRLTVVLVASNRRPAKHRPNNTITSIPRVIHPIIRIRPPTWHLIWAIT